MKQLIVEIADDDMRVLEKVAKHRARDPAELLREQVSIFVTAQRTGSTGERLKSARPAVLAQAKRKARQLQALAEKRNDMTLDGISAVGQISNMLLEKLAPETTRRQDADAATTAPVDGQNTARERRLQILRRTSGLMKNAPDFPKDGLQYQTEARAEWD